MMLWATILDFSIFQITIRGNHERCFKRFVFRCLFYVACSSLGFWFIREIIMDERVAELLKTDEFSPSNIFNFGEAIVDGSNPEQVERIKELFENRDFEALGRFLWNQSITYWERIAEDVACDQLAKSSFPYEER